MHPAAPQPQPMDPAERSGRQIQIIRRLHDLVEPFDEVSPKDVWDERFQVWRPGGGPHVVSMPSLLNQLRHASAVQGASGATGTYESRVVVPVDAIDAETRITVEAATFVRYSLHAPANVPAEQNLTRIRDRVQTLTDEELLEVERLVRSWWVSARILAQLDERPLTPHMRCPLCDAADSIRVRLDGAAGSLDVAWCRQCGEAWDESTRGLLEAEIEAARLEAEKAAAESAEAATPEPLPRSPRVDYVYLGGEGAARRWARDNGISPALVYPATRGLTGLWGRSLPPIVVEPYDTDEYIHMAPELQRNVDAVDQHLTNVGAPRDLPGVRWPL